MSLTPLLSASPLIQLHVCAALLSVALLPWTLFRRRRDRVHKRAGYVWLLAMLVTALSSFWIHSIRLFGPFSPIHVLSAVTLVNLGWALWEVRRRNIKAHERILKATAFWALGVAGLFTLLPGRLMSQVLFGQAQLVGFVAVAVLWLGLGLGLKLRGRSARRRLP